MHRRPYGFADARYRQLGRPAYSDWPAGLLCTSANDFAKFLHFYTQRGGGILAPQALAAMMTPDPVLPDAAHPEIRQGLIWRTRPFGGGRVASHTGGDPGAAPVAAFDIDRQTGALAFANISPTPKINPFQKEVIQRLLDKAASL